MSETAIITGASRGIGRATAMRFLTRGARVINLSRTAAGIPGVLDLPVDLGQADFVRSLEAPLARAIDTGPDTKRLVVVHCAAALVRDQVETVDAASLRLQVEVALVAPVVINQLLIPGMARGSSILYLGSTLSSKAIAGSFSYVTIKHAVIGMMRATCQDLLGRGIHTACICPGVTDTEMLRERTGGDPRVLDSLRAMTGEGRLIEPDEIARVIEATADNPVLNGAVIHANLGQRER